MGIEFSHPSLEGARALAGLGIAKTRGLNVLAALAYARSRGGRDVMQRIFERLEPEDIELLSQRKTALGPIRTSDWFPFQMHCRLLRAIDAELGDGDLGLLEEVGDFMAERDIRRVFRPFLRAGNPGWVFEFARRMWGTYHDRGRWQIERTPLSLLATLHDHPETDEAFCRTFVAWTCTTLRLSGAVNVVGDHPACRARGAQNCVFTCHWELP